MNKSNYDKAIVILDATGCGEYLDPRDLGLVEAAINANLNDKGIERFNELYIKTTTNGYKKPWLHGIEHLTIDLEGTIYWKGSEIEMVNLSCAFSDDGKGFAEELARRCKHIESLGLLPENHSVIESWEGYYKHREKEEE